MLRRRPIYGPAPLRRFTVESCACADNPGERIDGTRELLVGATSIIPLTVALPFVPVWFRSRLSWNNLAQPQFGHTRPRHTPSRFSVLPTDVAYEVCHHFLTEILHEDVGLRVSSRWSLYIHRVTISRTWTLPALPPRSACLVLPPSPAPTLVPTRAKCC